LEQLLEILGKIVIYLITGFGYGGVFFAMVLESACIPLPSEIIHPFAGYLVFTGKFVYWKITIVAAIANVIGGLISYYIGKYGGRPLIIRYGKYLLISEYKLRKTEIFFEKYGEYTVFFGRMLPVVRTFISLPAGIARMNALKMSIYTFLGSLPWCALLIWAGKELGENWQRLEPLFHRFHIVTGDPADSLLLFLYLFYFPETKKEKTFSR
jgi:membrane protein DedA with SNARE-associated domain